MTSGRIYDLRSDTVTKPSRAMREEMANAEVGDDMSGEDPTVNRLEALCAARFGKEAAVFACSGTQSNQMGVRVHCRPGDELLCHETGHIVNFEAGAPAALSGVSSRTIPGDGGMIDVPQLRGKVRSGDQHLACTRLVCLENTTNVGGGRAYPLEQIARVGAWAHELGLKVHVDGARLFNAVVARGYSPKDVGKHVDTISVCFSKGLGCPMGSILVGSAEEIRVAPGEKAVRRRTAASGNRGGRRNLRTGAQRGAVGGGPSERPASRRIHCRHTRSLGSARDCGNKSGLF